MVRTTHTDEAQIQRTYSQLTFLGLLLHSVQAILFIAFSLPIPVIYNIVSIIFYAFMLHMTRHRRYRVTVSCIHIETCLFALFIVISCGWGSGVALYLLAMSSLVYFCPFERKSIPYLFSIAELAVFVLLRIHTYYNDPIYGNLPRFAEMAYYIFNALACFYIVLYAAYSSNISAVVTNFRLRSENQNLSAIANSDFLTALPSRRAFFQQIKMLPHDTKVIAAIGDLDDFKQINDNMGHVFGDEVLRTVGHLIQTECGDHAIPCRWGGEEFVILFYNCSEAESVRRLQNLCRRIESYAFGQESLNVNVTITFGAYSGQILNGMETLINEADKYLYQGKQSGKNCVCSPFDISDAKMHVMD